MAQGERMETLKHRMKIAYVHHRNLVLKGYQEIGVLVGMTNMSMLLWLCLRDFFGLSRRWIFLIPFIWLLALVCMYFYGWVWDRKKMFDEEHLWHSRRSPYMRGMYERIMEADRETNGD